MRFLMGLLIAGIVCTAQAERAAISIDGRFDDWAELSPAYVDALGDSSAPSGFDFGRLWLADDETHLYFRFETTVDVDPSGTSNHAVLFIDADNDPNTGYPYASLGAETIFAFGRTQIAGQLFFRSGMIYLADGSPGGMIRQADLGLFGLPTIDGNDFEFAIARSATGPDQQPLFQSDQIAIALVGFDFGGSVLDRLPNPGSVLSYTFDLGTPVPPAKPISIDNRLPEGTQRILSYNVLRDGPWEAGNEGMGRIVAAVAGDIMCFQEIYQYTADQTAEWVATWHPDNPSGDWHRAKVSDCVTISRWPILESWDIAGNLATLVSITEGNDSQELLLVNCHFACCENDDFREYEIDRILTFIRDQRADPNQPLIEPDTPIVITGDMNLVGRAGQLNSLLTGDVLRNDLYGPDFTMDADGTAAEFVYARHTHTRRYHTWRDDGSLFWPGRLDYLISTDSSYTPLHSFVLETRTMATDALAAHGLQVRDSGSSDHLALVADFAIDFKRGDLNQDGLINEADINPFVQALLNPAGFEAANPLVARAAADLNQDGLVNTFDIDPLVECILNGCD